ncbi:LysR substrate-binding domain-containing protein [Crenobacter sp. SG2305]|uniref:LysR substrate-binding domain-containing protein n=1 Tax=Crenobacter oryzisoli TaxID=3056844 RepID=UPI0025AAF4E0|nr:LysR substrate-binding domain-containing protein [Crenobacter sp. SG2305]MDN0081715.1 LysR substrate-binding domain-containing protein [Crenobacter sp. SG2305]
MQKNLFQSRIRLRHLHCFVAVAQEQNLGRAAAKLTLSQPAVSKTLSELEELVGARLLERGRHGATLTPQGEVFLVHAVGVLEALGAAGRAIGPEEAPTLATVSIGTLPTAALDLLPNALGAFRETNSNTRVVVQTAANAPLLAMLKAGEVDFAIGRMADPELMVGVSFELLFVEPLELVTRPGHPLAVDGLPSLEAVLDYPLIVSPRGTVPRHNTESFLQSRGLRLPANVVEMLSVSLARLMAQRFDYVWCVSSGAVRDDLEKGLLARLDLSTVGTEEPVGLIRRSESTLSASALDLISIIRNVATSQRRG